MVPCIYCTFLLSMERRILGCFSHGGFTGSGGIFFRTLLDLDFRFYEALNGLVAFFINSFTLDLQAPAHERSPEYFAPR